MKRILIFLGLQMILVAALAQDNGTRSGIGPGLTNFPTYHPLVVHFPLVLLLVAAILQGIVLFTQKRAFNTVVIVLTLSGFLTGLLAATVFHPEPAAGISATAREMFEAHEQYAFATVWLGGAASLLKLAGVWIPKKWIELVAALLLLASAVTVTVAGHHGSELVYKQGIGPQGKQLNKHH